MTVERGPLASQYKDIKIYIIAECEKELFSVTTSADTIHLSVDFKSECSTVEIYQPVDNWIYNSSQGDKFNVALTGYNANDPNLESVIVQYRREGRGWEDGVEIPKDSLIDKFYDAKLNAKYLLDGNYQLRAVANCRSKLSTINYSEVVNGKIDRKKLELFGSPYPKNGILRYSDEIKIICSEDIDPSVKYYPGKISLQQKDNKKFYPVTYQIKGSELIINPSPISILDNLEGKTLIATVNSIEDLSGNVTTAPIQWEFMVSRSPVYWEPNYINYTMERGKPGNFTATLKNGGPTAGNFTITKYPIWLSPDILSGSVGSLGGTQNITMTVASGINPGIYSDTVIALSGSYKISLFVRLEVLTPEPRWVKQAIEASKFEHSMNIIAQFSVNATDIPLSMDIRDEIGVFINDSLRGKGKIKYDPQLRKYFAYITIYSNSENNDSMSFRMWDAYPGVQYRAVETRVFRKDALLGQFSSPFILHPKGIYQTISMKKGWNWFSLFVKNVHLRMINKLQTYYFPK